MLNVGSITSRTCGGLSRRAFLQVGSVGALGLGLGDLLALKSTALASNAPAGRAKSVIFLWLWGGPSHLETFDPKPDAPIEYRGPFESIASAIPGVRVGELLPELAKRSDQYAIIRSMHHESNDHGVAGTIALTGSIGGAVDLGGGTQKGALKPATGAIVGRLHRGKPGPLPPYVILGTQLHQGLKRVVGEGGGILGTPYDPFRLDYEPGVGVKVPDVELPESVTAQRFGARWDLLRGVEASVPETRLTHVVDQHYELARTLISSRASLAALDLEQESPKLRERYGRHRVGQCCLMARRLVEAGIPFVQVNWSTHVEGPEDAGDGGWDMHDRYFQIMQDRHGWMLDQALSALLDDLRDRRLLESTIVVAMGEFGRTPKINDKAGRDHWNLCYSALLSGGGIAGGRLVGASDKRAEHPVDTPVTPADVGATILDRLGFTSAELTGVGLVPQGRAISELV